ncbi:MAG: ABC transporter ATP-binding protein [Tissierellia bacterium]|nr:ABC transporter ATP-binding protein [Tissierellia bacterium]MDD4726367.1 ABC transporter ATP-binding protein [Tissierellia bacterium]
MILELKNLTKMYDDENGVSNFNLTVERGEFITLLGPSGCGKTTTLNLIGGFLKADSGQVIMEGKDISGLPPESRKVSTVFQNYALFPHLNVLENVAYGIRFFMKYPKKKALSAAKEFVDLVGLSGYEKSNIGNLSGGQQQRVALARSIATGAEVLLLDEPLSNLDVALRTHLRRELKEIQRKTKTTMIYVTHDQEEGLSLSDRIVVMDKGLIVQIGRPKEIYYKPANLYVADFVGKSNFIEDEKGNQYILRPEDVNIRENPDGKYIIEEMVFLGHRTEYILRKGEEKVEVHLQGIRGNDFNIGANVDIEILFKSKLNS